MLRAPRYEHGIHRLWSLLETMPRTLRSVSLWTARTSPPPRRATLSYHSVPTVAACMEGVLRVWGGPTGRVDLHPGEMLVIAAGVQHAHEPLRSGSASFEQGFLARCSDLKVCDHQRELLSRVPLQPCRLLVERIVRLGPEAKAAKARCAVGVELFAQLLRETIEPLERPSPALQRMVQVLWHRMHEPIGTRDIVAASGLGRSQSYVAFRDYFGESIKAALLRHRLELAQELLREGYAVGEVARRCGFPSRANFTRSFRRAVGRPPRAVRGS